MGRLIEGEGWGDRMESLCMYVCMYVCKDVCRLAGKRFLRKYKMAGRRFTLNQ